MELSHHGDGAGRSSDQSPPPAGAPSPLSSPRDPSGSETGFQFIDVSQNDTPEQRSRNRTIARSHVMRKVRQGQKRQIDPDSSRRRSSQSMREGQIAELLRRRSRTGLQGPGALTSALDPSEGLSSEVFSQQLQRNINSSYMSDALRMEADLGSNPLFNRRWTPLVFEMMNHSASFLLSYIHLKVIWPLFWPATSPDELNPMALDWWKMFRTSPLLFHASTHSAAAHLDSLRSSTSLTRTAEALAHKTEAIRLINEELSRMQKDGGLPDDALLMAVLSMTSEVDPTDELIAVNDATDSQSYSPFKPPLMSAHWEKQFAQIRSAKFHETALYTLMKMRGGIDKITNICVAKSMSHHELLAAAMDLRKPQFAFFEAPGIIALTRDPMLNVLTVPMDEQRGRALPDLLAYGVTEQALIVMLDLQHISVIIEAYTQGTLQNPEVLALTSRRNAIHHALLSLPTMDEVEPALTEDQKSVYESCRLAAVIYDLSIIFPIPPFAGVIQQLVFKAKVVLESMRLEIVLGAGAKPLTWVLFVAGTAAECMSERPWFVERLKLVLAAGGIRQWDTVMGILNSYLWMESAMSEAAFNLWNEISMA